MSSRRKARETRQRRHRNQERQLARGRPDIFQLDIIQLKLRGDVAGASSGAGHLRASASGGEWLLDPWAPIDLDQAPQFSGAGRLEARVRRPGRRPFIEGLPSEPHVIEMQDRSRRDHRGAVDVSEVPWALVFLDHRGTPTWTYHETAAQAQAEAEARNLTRSELIGVVDVTRVEKNASIPAIMNIGRPMIDNPYGPEIENFDVRQIGGSYSGYRNPTQYNGANRAEARPLRDLKL